MKTMILGVFASLTLAALPLTAFGDDPDFGDRWYVAPQLSHSWPDSKENTNNGNGWQVDVGRALDKDWNLEGAVLSYSADCKIGGCSFRQTTYGVNGLWFFKRDAMFAPFLLVGGGFNSQENLSTKPFGTVGVGALVTPWDWGGFRGQVQELHTFGDGNFNDLVASIGMIFYFGGTAEAPAPRHEPARVEPAPQPAPAPAPAPEPVAAAPVPPPAPAPAPVPAPQKVIALEGVEFANASDRLLPSSRTTLDAAVKTLRDNPGVEAEVAGYTDNKGKSAYNKSLSQHRAEAVMKYLVAHGIAASRLTAKGYGEADPVASNDTAAGRAKNRRVELHITKQ